MRILYKGENRAIGVEVLRCDGQEFIIDESEFEIRNDKNNVLESGLCEIDHDNQYVYAFFDTDAKDVNNDDIYEADNKYYVYFKIKIIDEPKEIIGRVTIKIEP